MEDDATLMRVSLNDINIIYLNYILQQTSCGTVYYVAPELRSKTRITHGYTNRVDSFGVGAVLYYWYAAHFLSSLFKRLTFTPRNEA